MSREAAVLRWTGRGKAPDLVGTVGWVMKERGIRGIPRLLGRSVVVETPSPVHACAVFENTPGIAWTAAGFAAGSLAGATRAGAALARRYLSRGTRFSVLAESDGMASSDLAGAVTSAMLEAVKGARATREGPGTRFHAAGDGSDLVVGVELSAGPGGTATGGRAAACLVSGGLHSSVTAWHAALAGYRVDLVHAPTGEASLRAVARLYSEMSHRMDPRALTLTVVEGTAPWRGVVKFASGAKGPIYGGFTPHRRLPKGLEGRVEAPLALLTEEEFASQFRGLGLEDRSDTARWSGGDDGRYAVRRFGGRASGVSEVLDGLS